MEIAYSLVLPVLLFGLLSGKVISHEQRKTDTPGDDRILNSLLVIPDLSYIYAGVVLFIEWHGILKWMVGFAAVMCLLSLASTIFMYLRAVRRDFMEKSP